MAFKKVISEFAESGDTQTVPEATQGDGTVSYEQGFGPDYDRNLATDPQAQAIPRDRMNGLFQDITGNIQHWQENTYPEYVTAAQNGGTTVTYPFGAIVTYDSGSGSLPYQVSNTAGASSLPTTTADWNALPVNGTEDNQVRLNSQNDARFTARPSNTIDDVAIGSLFMGGIRAIDSSDLNNNVVFSFGGTIDLSDRFPPTEAFWEIAPCNSNGGDNGALITTGVFRCVGIARYDISTGRSFVEDGVTLWERIS